MAEKSDDVRTDGDGKPLRSVVGRRVGSRASRTPAETVRPPNERLLIILLGAYSFFALAAITYMSVKGIDVPESLIITLGAALGYLGSKLTK